MDALAKKTLVSRRGFTYTYYASDGQASPQTPALFFVHGFPDSAHLWKDVIAALGPVPNKIIAPDCLGYAGTDKPTDTRMYAYEDQADEMAEILDAELAEHAAAHNVVIIGHDWGSPLAQRTYLRHRARFVGVVLLNTGYMLPSADPFDLDTVNRVTEQVYGYPQFKYWEFFCSDEAPAIIDAHLDRMWQALHGDVKDWMQTLFCVPDAMRHFVMGQGADVPLRPYAQKPEWRDAFLAQFGRDGFAGALQMYKATALNVQSASYKAHGGGTEDLTISVPLLFVLCAQDAVCRPEMMDPAKQQGLVPQLEEVTIDCAHWSPMEKPGEIAELVKGFLKKCSERP